MPLRSDDYAPPSRWRTSDSFNDADYYGGNGSGYQSYDDQGYDDEFDDEAPESIGRPLLASIVSAVLPGIGHAMAGRKRTGRVLLTGMLLLLATIGVAYVGLGRSGIAAIAVDADALLWVFMGAMVLGIAWSFVIISAFLVNKPDELTAAQRAAATFVIGVLCLVVLAPAAIAAYYTNIQRSTITSIFTSGKDAKPNFFADKPRVNILMLGSDAAEGRDGVRTDTMIVSSIDTANGRTVMFSLPRNLQGVPFPDGTPADHEFPNGFSGEPLGNYLLNAVYRYGTEHSDLVPDAENPGEQLLEQAIEAALGIEIDYYIIIDLKGFEGVVDALGGVHIVVKEERGRPIPIGGKRDANGDVEQEPSGYLPVGKVTLDGEQALWYARSRFWSDDYFRMARQQCVLGAIARQATPANVLRGYQELAETAKSSIETDIPEEAFQSLVELAANGKTAKITSLSFNNKVIKPADPDFGEMRDLVDDAIQQAIEDVRPSATPTPGPSTSPVAMELVSSTRSLAQQEDPETDEPDPGEAVSVDDVCEYW